MLCFPPSTAAKSTRTRYQSTMLANILVTLVTVLPALAASLSSRAAPEGRSCGTQISKERVLEAERHFDANRVVSNSSSERATIDIPVRFDYSSLSSGAKTQHYPDRSTGMRSMETTLSEVATSLRARSIPRCQF